MNIIKYIFICLFIFSCDSNNSVSSNNSSVCSDLSGIWTLTAQGTIDGDSGDCTGQPPTTLSQGLSSHSLTLHDDCTFSSDAISLFSDCSDTSSANYSISECTGEWQHSGSNVTLLSGTFLEFGYTFEMLNSSGYSYVLNSDNTVMSLFLAVDTTNDNVSNPDECQYSEYTKQ